MYSLAKIRTEETIIISVLKNTTDKKSTRKLSSNKLKLKNKYTSSFKKKRLIAIVNEVSKYQNEQTICNIL